ncbi:MAG: hypothetical protein WA324_18615 [Bryobacteraceae bacterium]
MGLADDLLDLADRLATPAPTVLEQASLRRAVSTAYYALFHLLAGEVGQLWQGVSATSGYGVERALEHTRMKEVSRVFSETPWTDWSGQTVAVPPELSLVADAFVSLQHERHEADYNSGRTWAPLEAQSKIQQVRLAFQQWRAVRTQAVAQDYLLSLLIGKKRR